MRPQADQYVPGAGGYAPHRVSVLPDRVVLTGKDGRLLVIHADEELTAPPEVMPGPGRVARRGSGSDR
ncbi:MAG: hypothetical protein AB1758_19035, partial [Candidatus Eremiobacterota bacterium]